MTSEPDSTTPAPDTPASGPGAPVPPTSDGATPEGDRTVPTSETDLQSRTSLDPSAQHLDEILTVYGMIHETHRYEGDGIWNRFNILVSVNIVLLGAFSFLVSSDVDSVALLGAIAIAGIFITGWALYVLKRLWTWHRHWSQMLRDVEATYLPSYLPKPFLNRPARLGRRPSKSRDWLFAYTQPFMIIFLLLWIAILIMTPTGTYLPEDDPPATEPAPSTTTTTEDSTSTSEEATTTSAPNPDSEG